MPFLKCCRIPSTRQINSGVFNCIDYHPFASHRQNGVATKQLNCGAAHCVGLTDSESQHFLVASSETVILLPSSIGEIV